MLGLTLALAGCTTSEPSSEAPASEGEDGREATVAFDFQGERDEEPQTWQAGISYDPDERPADEAYEDTNASRPDAYTVHDLLVEAQEETNTSLELAHEDGLGYHVSSVEGVPEGGSSQAWTLFVDDERETAGVNTLTVEENATYEWRLEDRGTDQAGSTDEERQATGDTDEGSSASSEDDGSGDGGTNGTRSDTQDTGSSTTQEATMIVDYNGFRDEDPQRTEHRVSYDPDARPTMPLYEDADTSRPDAYILHDLVSDWSNQTGTDHIAREDGSSGFRLNTVDGVTAHSTQGGSWRWTLAVDGEAETASLNSVRVQPGSTYEWTFERTSDR